VDPIVWIIIVILVALLVLGLALMLLSKKRKERHLEEAHEHRAAAREEISDVTQRKQEAAAAQARAEEARLEAERSEQAARQSQTEAQQREAQVEERLRTADKLDPNVDHKSDDYAPDPNRVHDDPAHRASHDTGHTGATGTPAEGTRTHPTGSSATDAAQGRPRDEYEQGYVDGATEGQDPDGPPRRA
jgi:FtsZ-interacting cell division protein ZipA